MILNLIDVSKFYHIRNIPKGLIFFLKENLFIVHVVVAKKNIKMIYISHKSIDSMEVKFRLNRKYENGSRN